MLIRSRLLTAAGERSAAPCSAALRSDLERFIVPLARYRKASIQFNSMRRGSAERKGYASGSPVTRITPNLGSSSESVQHSSQARADDSQMHRSKGIRAEVTYFSPRVNNLLNRPLSERSIDVTVPLYRCPICCNRSGNVSSFTSELTLADDRAVMWMDPMQITQHMAWLHASSGWSQADFAVYNNLEIARLYKALPQPVGRPADSSKQAATLPRIVIMLDVANIELGYEDELLELLRNKEYMLFFSRVPCVFVCVHEVFIPHISRPGHVFFQLSRLHPCSDMFTMYAATRCESGDLLSAVLMGELFLRNMRGCAPAIVLLTRDQIQKQCVSSAFCGAGGHGARVLLPRSTAESIMNCLREANYSMMGL
ncbi:hypothetical protein ERJ75_000874900 [Trypanosoma vivax]|uniref:Uncharacterized protein n=1 Tax=Trypanosoma vivax (strain Y486) TaxID=1055687 RepID=G0TXN0_TRYVY|nr:hypothetical protein TRVL_02630 [Trypanosoma vivax]KAH8612531.1 hypothetical protein ERJ75_000874900 [Trypanosoma vivax]CCC48721.1 conserved hypothetical protein [Trypanosoma vivax Y486]